MKERKETGVTYEALRLREVALNSFFAKGKSQLRVMAVDADESLLRKACWMVSSKDMGVSLSVCPTAEAFSKSDAEIAGDLSTLYETQVSQASALVKQIGSKINPSLRAELMDGMFIELLGASNVSVLERESRPYVPVLDMIASLRCLLKLNGDHVATVRVTESLLDALGLTLKEAVELGMGNLANDAVIRPMSRIIEENLDLEDEPADGFAENMYVVSNSRGTYGAGLMVSRKIQSELLDIFGGKGIMLLPSSIHEFIAIPGDFMTLDEAREMVREVNATEVEPEERLTDEVYLLTGTPENPILAMKADLGLPERSLIVAD